MGHKWLIFTVFFCDIHLPVCPVFIQGGLHSGVSGTIDAVFHEGNRLSVKNGTLVEFPVIYREPKSAILVSLYE